MYILIVGCGKAGSHLANSLSKEGNDVVVIDNREEAFNNLSAEFTGFNLLGDATELEILKQGKIEQADVVTVTTTDDNVNSMIAQIAKEIFEVPEVVARVFAPRREEIYNQLGIDTICPTTLSVVEFEKVITR
ncbi:potassium channel family protein [Selenihalanaerobacter shriftii]|uniref:Trk system potassium uptake protein TrkA n=1 Tax=Selenihalanaerobacter shriftii TaxID=142842 RepID=A0A1T4QXR0_9FIRM|nr:NAD-binding protein [Selenihalanaerobacter shriftii]SKA08118.1 trk system potassium uptake protein TrkA [Selenihalanaerobacter shriftii]